ADAGEPLPSFVVVPVVIRAYGFLLEIDHIDINLALAYLLTLPESKPQRDLLRALLICEHATVEIVAGLCGLDPEVVQLFESLFWNCLQRKQERPYIMRICNQTGSARVGGSESAKVDLSLEPLRIAYQSGRTELVLATASVA